MNREIDPGRSGAWLDVRTPDDAPVLRTLVFIDGDIQTWFSGNAARVDPHLLALHRTRVAAAMDDLPNLLSRFADLLRCLFSWKGVIVTGSVVGLVTGSAGVMENPLFLGGLVLPMAQAIAVRWFRDAAIRASLDLGFRIAKWVGSRVVRRFNAAIPPLAGP